jgi:hypothetical protein
VRRTSCSTQRRIPYIHYTPSDTRRGLCIGLKLHRVTATLARPSAKPCHICTRTGLAPRQASSLRRSISASNRRILAPRRKSSVADQYSTVTELHVPWWQPDRARLLCAAQVCRDQCPFPEQLGPRVRQRQLIRRSVFAAQASASRSATCTRTNTRPTAGITRTFWPQSRCWSSQSSTANPARWAYHA